VLADDCEEQASSMSLDEESAVSMPAHGDTDPDAESSPGEDIQLANCTPTGEHESSQLVLQVDDSTDAEALAETASDNTHEAPPTHAASHLSQPVSSAPVALPAATLGVIGTRLAAEIGPVAPFLVAQYATRASDLTELAALLLAHIPCSAGRERFSIALTMMRDETAPAPVQDDARERAPISDEEHGTTLGHRERHASLLPEQVQDAAWRLAHYVGPVAHVIAKREAGVAPDLRTFHENLASSIGNEADRAAFRRAVS
jgi:serine/threonine-protein kinase